MTARVSDYKNALYSRDYSHDAPPQETIVKRAALAAIPFLSLHRPFRLPISVVMGSMRVWNHTDLLDTAVAVTALAGTLFQHRVGMCVTTMQDILIEMGNLYNGEEPAKSLVKIVNSLIYLALISRGGLELSIVAFALQATLNLIQSREEFKSDRWMEGVAHLLMAGVRLHQGVTHYQQLQRNWEIEAAIKKIYVGELHEKWQFPSDHLPVGIEVNGVKIISWNVLNNAYMEWVTDKDSQGLDRSLISDLNVAVDPSGLTMRDVLVATQVQQMMAQGQVVALQECGEPFLRYLEQRLDPNWSMVRSFSSPRVDQDVILYNKTHLTYQASSSQTTRSAYPSFPGRPLQNAYFSSVDGQDLRIINAHIPGDPTKPGREEFARYVQEQHREGSITVALGDNNFEREEMIDAYRKAGFSEFSLHSPWQTNIDPYTKESKGIDHFFVIGDEHSRDLRVDEVLKHLQETIDLLRSR